MSTKKNIEWSPSIRTVIILTFMFGLVLFSVWQWSIADKPLVPSEGVMPKLGEAWNALWADPTRAIREGRAEYIELFLILMAVAIPLEIIMRIARFFKFNIPPVFETSVPFVVFTGLAAFFAFMLEAGASAYGWYNIFATTWPYNVMFTGQVVPGIAILAPPPHWGGAPFDAFTHIPAGVVVCSIILNFGLVRWFNIKPHWKIIICVAIASAALILYEARAPQPPVEYWNAVLDIVNDISGAGIAAVAYDYLVPETRQSYFIAHLK